MLRSVNGLGYTEITLIQCILWIGIWLADDYLGSLLTVILVPIFFFILLVSLIAELIERSKVPRKFFVLMMISTIIPMVIAALVFYLYEGAFDWLADIY